MTIRPLKKGKDSASLRHDRSQAEIITEVVQDASNVSLLACLDGLLADEDLLADTARRSHRHQLGFWKYVLMVDDEGRALRMHLWDRDHYVLEDIHSHCADFTSRIVFGRLTENAFNLVEGSSLASFLYRFDEGVGHSVAVPNGHVEGSLRSSRVLGPNEVYSKTAQELHNVSDVEVGTVTVSAWFQRSHDALVLKGANACAEDCVATIGIEIGELRLVLEEIRKRISAK